MSVGQIANTVMVVVLLAILYLALREFSGKRGKNH
jgi:hypothetical protein